MNISFHGTIGNIDIAFEPDDPAFAKRVFDAIEQLHKLQKELDRKTNGKLSNRQYFDESNRIEKLMRETIDNALGFVVCEPLCGDYNVYGKTESGDRFWELVMYSVADRLSVRRAIRRHWMGD